MPDAPLDAAALAGLGLTPEQTADAIAADADIRDVAEFVSMEAEGAREADRVVGIDPAQEGGFNGDLGAALRAHVDGGGVIQFQEGVGANQVVTSDGTSFHTMPIAQWTHNMVTGTSSATIDYRVCDIDESCGQKDAAPEPTAMEAWKD